MVTPMIGLRIPDWLLEEVEAYGKENFPKDGQWEKTATLLSLIQRGLQSEGIAVNAPVKHIVNSFLDIPSLKEEIKEELKEEILNNLNDRFSNIEEVIKNMQKHYSVEEIEDETKSKTPPEEKENLPSDESKLVTSNEGLTYQELATKKGLKRSTVKSWIDRGLPTKGDNAKYSSLYEIKNGKFYRKKITGG